MKTAKKKSSYYLYDSGLQELKDMKYIEALRHKIFLADKLIHKLQKVDYMSRDSVRINDCLKAIKFNEDLIEEVIKNKE